jgi:hypothetical protein
MNGGRFAEIGAGTSSLPSGGPRLCRSRGTGENNTWIKRMRMRMAITIIIIMIILIEELL